MPDRAGRGVIAVTGASGFIGRYTVPWLQRQGWPVRRILRVDDGALTPDDRIVPNLTDVDSVSTAFEGVDAVVHLAARVHVMNERAVDALAEYRRVNVDMTKVLLQAAKARGATHFVQLSSVKAIGEWGDGVWDEETPESPESPYGVSKLECDRVIVAAREEGVFSTTVLRIPLVYGPGVKANMLKLLQLVDRGIPIPTGSPPNRRSYLFLGNLASAIGAVLANPRESASTFLLADDEPLSTRQLVEYIAAALHRTPRVLEVPAEVLSTLGRVGDAVNRHWRVPLSSGTIQRIVGSLAVSASKFRQRLEWTAPYGAAEGMRITADWYRARTSAATSTPAH